MYCLGLVDLEAMAFELKMLIIGPAVDFSLVLCVLCLALMPFWDEGTSSWSRVRRQG
jgi:hypothetical protein